MIEVRPKTLSKRQEEFKTGEKNLKTGKRIRKRQEIILRAGKFCFLPRNTRITRNASARIQKSKPLICADQR
jgi:hypothetical protein